MQFRRAVEEGGESSRSPHPSTSFCGLHAELRSGRLPYPLTTQSPTHSQRSVLKYFNPESHIITATVFPL